MLTLKRYQLDPAVVKGAIHILDHWRPVVHVALFALEVIVTTLQAYVFTILTCLYLRDAVHLH